MLCLALAATQQIAGHVLDGGEVGRRVRAPYAALVVAEHHVHHPVQPILDAPVAAHRVAYLLGVARQRADVVARSALYGQPSTGISRRLSTVRPWGARRTTNWWSVSATTQDHRSATTRRCFRRPGGAVYDRSARGGGGSPARRCCRSFDRAAKQGPIHMISAWSSQQRLVMAPRCKVANPVASRSRRSRSCCSCWSCTTRSVTIDAMGCQRTIAAQIIDQNADYVFHA